MASHGPGVDQVVIGGRRRMADSIRPKNEVCCERGSLKKGLKSLLLKKIWWRGGDLNSRPSGYEPDELPDCSTPRRLN